MVQARTALAAPVLALAALAAAVRAESQCAQRVFDHPEEFAPCLEGGTVCFLFLSEGPFVKLPKSLPPADGPDALQRPFPCSEFAARGLGGIAFNVLNRTSPRHTELCALAAAPGTQCTFNELVDLLRRSDDPASPTHRMTLAALGGLLFTPRRVKLGVSSDPVLENKVVIVRKRSDDSVLTTRAGVRAAWEAAWKPFSTEAWKLCFGATAALLSFIGLVSCCRPTPVALSGNWPRKQFATWAVNFIRSTVGGGSVDLSNPTEAGFEPARTVLRTGLFAIIGITVIYYEAALIIGQSKPQLSSAVSGQSNEQLCRWTVLNDSALEESWAAIVDSGRTDDRIDFANLHRDNSIRRWPTCGSFGDCFEQVNRGAASDQTPDCAATGAKIQYIVSFETIVWHEFRLHPEYCDTLEVVGTSETLFDFNAGWIYADVDNGTLGRSQRREIDEGIRTARRDRITAGIVEREAGSELLCPGALSQVSSTLMLFPILGALLLPICAALLLMALYPSISPGRRRPARLTSHEG